MRGKLTASLRDRRDATGNLGGTSAEALKDHGLVVGKSPPNLLWNEARDMWPP